VLPTTLLARTATAHHAGHHVPSLLIVGLALAGLASYAIACAEAPFRDCLHCGGDGRNGPGARSDCKHCDGTGLQLRYGRRAYNHLTRARHAARRADDQRTRDTARRQRDERNPWKDPR
jgi:hypothetical protein